MSGERTAGAYADVWKRVAIIAAALALLGAASYGAAYLQRMSVADRGYLDVAGNVRAEVYTVRAPAVMLPTPDYAVGIPGAATSRSTAQTTASGTTGQPTVSGLLTEVYVTEGDVVTAGAPVARLDTAMLDLGVEQAKAAAVKARADAAVLADTLDSIGSNQSDLASARRDLQAALAEAKTQRAELAAQLSQLQNMPTPPPGSVPPTGSIPPSSSVPPTGTPIPDPAALIAKLKAALAQIDAGIAKMESGLRTIASGSVKLADAKTQVENGRELMLLVADSRDIAIDVARVRRESAVITSPVDGLVLFARRSGGVAMVNAPVVRIRPAGPMLVDTYLTAEQLSRVSIGDAAEVAYDSSADTVLVGRVTGIADSSVFPPTTFPTDIVHMTRVTRVTITLDDGAQPPAGTPVDITIRTDSRSLGA